MSSSSGYSYAFGGRVDSRGITRTSSPYLPFAQYSPVSFPSSTSPSSSGRLGHRHTRTSSIVGSRYAPTLETISSSRDGDTVGARSSRTASRAHRRASMFAAPANSPHASDTWTTIESNGRQSRNGWKYEPKEYSANLAELSLGPPTMNTGQRYTVDSIYGTNDRPPPSYRSASSRRRSHAQAPSSIVTSGSLYPVTALSTEYSATERHGYSDPHTARTAPSTYLQDRQTSHRSRRRRQSSLGLSNHDGSPFVGTRVSYSSRNGSRGIDGMTDGLNGLELSSRQSGRHGRHGSLASPSIPSSRRTNNNDTVGRMRMEMPGGTMVELLEVSRGAGGRRSLGRDGRMQERYC